MWVASTMNATCQVCGARTEDWRLGDKGLIYCRSCYRPRVARPRKLITAGAHSERAEATDAHAREALARLLAIWSQRRNKGRAT